MPVNQNDHNIPGSNLETVGIIPAGGVATRISPLPCSKELMPIGFGAHPDGNYGPKVVSQFLLDKYKIAGVSKVFFIIRKGKWDIPGYYGDGSMMHMEFAYLLMNLPYGVPYTVDQAYPFVSKANIMLGFPDMLYGPDDAFCLANDTLNLKKADVVLGLYPPKDEHQIGRCDMVQWDETTGRIEKIVVKPVGSELAYIWILAVWTPVFTTFMHDYLKVERRMRERRGSTEEIHLGHIVDQAVAEGLHVVGHAFPKHHFIDIGTADELAQAYTQLPNMHS